MTHTTNPVFVISSMRSGSTLLRYLLDTHERLACPPESKFLTALEKMFDYPQVGAALRSMGSNRIDVLRLTRQYAESFFNEYTNRAGKMRWVDKTPNYYRILPFLEELFAESAYYILLVRNPLDCICSLEEMLPLYEYPADPELARIVSIHGKGRLTYARYWLEVNQTIFNFTRTLPARTFLVRYEDLVQAPEDWVGRIVRFIGEDPSLLDLEKAFTMKHDLGYQDRKISCTKAVHSLSIGRSSALSQREALNIWDIVGTVARELNYSLDDES